MDAPINPINPLDLTFYPNLTGGALWTALPLADASEPSGVKADTALVDDPRRIWVWSPRQLLSFEGTAEHVNELTAAGWECLPERTMAQTGLRIYHLWTQLREIRGMQMRRSIQLPRPPDTAGDKDVWARVDDLRAVERYPVALAFTIAHYSTDRSALARFVEQRAQGETYYAWVPETLPPPTLGTYGLVWTEGGSAGEQGPGWQRYDLEELPPAARALQARLADALRELAAPHSWYAVGKSTQKALEAVAQPFGYEQQKREAQSLILATSGRFRDMAKSQLQDLDTARERYEQMQRAARKYPPDIWLERWGEIQQMAQDLAAVYWEYHQRQRQPAEQTPARQLPLTPNIFRDNQALIPSPINALHIMQGLSSAAAWRKREDGRPYYHAETAKGRERGENTSTEMELRLEDAPEPPLPAQEQVAQLWQLTRARSDLDGDLFLAQWAQYLSAPKDAEGFVWFTSDLFLGYRGIEPITKAEPDGDRRRAGQRTEDKQEVSAAEGRQMAVWVKVRTMLLEDSEDGKDGKGANSARRKRSQARSRRQYTHESRLWLVPDVIRQHELTGVASHGPSSHLAAWRYKPGTWATPFLAAPNRHFALLCQTALQYDPYREQWEKRLARYFMFYLRISGGPNYGGTTIRRAVDNLLIELELPVDTDHPQRTRKRFEQALARLVADGVIDAWSYAKDNPTLPRRNWLSDWQRWGVYVTAAPLSRADLPEDRGQRETTCDTSPADA